MGVGVVKLADPVSSAEVGAALAVVVAQDELLVEDLGVVVALDLDVRAQQGGQDLAVDRRARSSSLSHWTRSQRVRPASLRAPGSGSLGGVPTQVAADVVLLEEDAGPATPRQRASRIACAMARESISWMAMSSELLGAADEVDDDLLEVVRGARARSARRTPRSCRRRRRPWAGVYASCRTPRPISATCVLTTGCLRCYLAQER